MAEINIKKLRNEITEMGALVEKALTLSTDPSCSLADIFLVEDQINDFHKKIDDNVFKYIALHAPHANDLRTALAIMKMNSDLERIADQSVNIKRYSLKLNDKHPQLDTMLTEVVQMVKNGLDSFATSNTQLATKVIKQDAEVNNLHREIIKEYIRKMQDEKYSFDEGFSVIRVAKNFERVGDHSTNICEDVIFLESGTDVRHNPEKKNERI